MNIVAIAVLVGIVALLLGWWVGSRATTGLRLVLAGKDAELASKTAELMAKSSDVQRLTSETQGYKDQLEHARNEKSTLEKELARSEEQLKAGQKSLADERASFTQLKEQMRDVFSSLAAKSLKDSNEQFVGMANREFDAKQNAIDALLQPVKESLKNLDEQTKQLETKRAGAYSEVLTEIKNIQTTHQALRDETSQLVQALRAPKARGNWGELQLQRCIEFAGMVEHCSFDTQQYMRGTDGDSAQRPDVVVRLPNGRCIVIDAKTPLDAFLSAMSAKDETQRATFLKAHAAQVAAHLTQLGSKQYWQRFQNSPDFVVCFLPSEVLFSAALEQDPSLIETGSQLNVILATPTTLIALLKAVAYGWQQMEITRNAQEICKSGEDLYRKLAGTQEHFTKLGNALTSSVKHFNNLVGTVEGRGSVFSLAAKLHELKIGQEEIAEIDPIETATRALQSDHWDAPITLAASAEITPDE